jgi:hypothetical protein
VYEFKHERERKEKIFKIYLILFGITAIATFFYSLHTYTSSLAGSFFSLVFSLIIIIFARKRKEWAIFLVKLSVWMHVVVLLLVIVVSILE